MKTREEKLARLFALGLLYTNEAAAVTTSDASVDTGGGGSTASASNEDSSSGGESEIDWGGMFDDSESSEQSSDNVALKEPVVTPAAPTVAATPSADPATAPTVTAAPATETQQVQPGTPPATPVTEVPQTQGQPQTPEQRQAAFEESRRAWGQQLTESYQLSQEQAELVMSDPGRVIPAMAADIHMRVTDNLMQLVRQAMPDLVAQQIRQNASMEENTNLFFKEWPELKGKEATIMQIGATWRQQNPTASREDFIKHVGALAWNAAGLSLQDLLARKSGGAGAPQPTASPTGGYMPAPQSAGGGVPLVSGESDNLFAELAQNWLND